LNIFRRKSKDPELGEVNRTPKAVKRNISDREFLEAEIKAWKQSPERKAMIQGEAYYIGLHDILKRKRTAIGKDGNLEEIKNLPNNKIVDNQYAKMVNQKTNYLLGQPLTFDTENKNYEQALSEVFDKGFHRMLKNLGENALNCGIAWLYPYYDEKGELNFMRFEPYEILPMWADAEHTKLDMIIRVYEVIVYESTEPDIKEKVEVYYPDKIEKYDFTDGQLVPDAEAPVSDYVVFEDESGAMGYNWGRVPVVAFKYNNRETPLIRRVKSLQDAINVMISDFGNNMQEDSRNTILIIKNYDGQNLGEFRQNLAAYGAVKVKTVDGADGGVDALTVQVNSENYKAILELLKKALIENAMGYDAKDDRLGSNANQLNIKSMYSDIDLDANNMECEFQAAFEDLLELLNMHFINRGQGDFSKDEVSIIFNRDMLMNESEVIDNCAKSLSILSEETVVANHPWISDLDKEMEKLKKQKEEDAKEAEKYNPFRKPNKDDPDDPKEPKEE
jgi:SPP1 family phage portal protein